MVGTLPRSFSDSPPSSVDIATPLTILSPRLSPRHPLGLSSQTYLQLHHRKQSFFSLWTNHSSQRLGYQDKANIRTRDVPHVRYKLSLFVNKKLQRPSTIKEIGSLLLSILDWLQFQVATLSLKYASALHAGAPLSSSLAPPSIHPAAVMQTVQQGQHLHSTKTVHQKYSSKIQV